MTNINIGDHIGHYRVDSILATGGSGQVFRAYDERLKRFVALKIFDSRFTEEREGELRIQREAQILASLNHPNIAVVYGLEQHHSSYAIAMELVEGATVADLVRQGSLPMLRAIEIGADITSALRVAHENDIIHRDLKPANVIVQPNGLAKLLDFGLAKLVTASEDQDSGNTSTKTVITSHGSVVGTLPYMSPELLSGQPPDARSDLWALGCVLFEMLAGQRPFTGTTIVDFARQTFEPDWSLLPPTAPDSCNRLIRRCLEKDRRKRLANAGDAELELEEALRELKGPSRVRDSISQQRKLHQRVHRLRFAPRIITATSPLIATILVAVLAYSYFEIRRGQEELASERLALFREMESTSQRWNIVLMTGLNGAMSSDPVRRNESIQGAFAFNQAQSQERFVRQSKLTQSFGESASKDYDAVQSVTDDLLGCFTFLNSIRTRHPEEGYTSAALRTLQDKTFSVLSRSYLTWEVFRENMKAVIDPQTSRRARDELAVSERYDGDRDCSQFVAPSYSEVPDDPYVLPVSIDVRVNGKGSEVNVERGKAFFYSWRGVNASYCEALEPTLSGVPTVGGSSVLPGQAYWYPPRGGEVTIRMTCGNKNHKATDVVVVRQP